MASRPPSPDRIRALLSLLAPRNKHVEARAVLAVTDPERYKKRWAERRRERSFDEGDDIDL